MTEEKYLIRIRWHVDRTVDPAMFMLVCTHPDYQDLQVSISSAEVSEISVSGFFRSVIGGA